MKTLLAILKTGRTVGTFVGGLPRTLTLGLLCASLLIGAWHWGERTLQNKLARAEQIGRDGERTRASQAIAAYAAQVTPLLQRADSAARAVDTTVRRHTQRATTAAAAIAAVPASIRSSEPTVDVALRACETLVADTAVITVAVMTERAAWRSVHVVDSVMVFNQAVLLVAKDDTIARRTKERDARPRWSTVVKASSAALGTGYVLAKWIIPRLTRGSRP